MKLTLINSQLPTPKSSRRQDEEVLVKFRRLAELRSWELVLIAAAFMTAATGASASAQSPYVNAIHAAKNAKAATEAADKKNSDALDPSASARQAPQSTQPANPPAPSTPQTAAGQGSKPTLPANGGYTYDPDGRRDPFVSLIGRGADVAVNPANRPAGLPGVLINEVSVKGIFKSDKGYIALLQTPDSKTYIVHAGEKLLDGSVKAITQDSVVFSQDVNDPLSLVKQREVRKSIRQEGR